MKNLVIIGAGGCGREVLQWAKDINEVEKRWHIKGFIDDNHDVLSGRKCDVAVLAKIDEYEIEINDEFVCAIGDARIRKRVVEKLKARGAKFITLIHPSAILADNCLLGEGVVIYPYTIISDNVIISDGCIINAFSSVGHDSVLGEYCTISAHCNITGMCRLGDQVFMGTTSHIIPGIKVGNGVYICAGSTVMTRVRDGVKILGYPAKILKL